MDICTLSTCQLSTILLLTPELACAIFRSINSWLCSCVPFRALTRCWGSRWGRPGGPSSVGSAEQHRMFWQAHTGATQYSVWGLRHMFSAHMSESMYRNAHSKTWHNSTQPVTPKTYCADFFHCVTQHLLQNVLYQNSWQERQASIITISHLIRMYNWIWILNDSMAGLNSIISLNQNLVNSHIKVLIIIKLDNGRRQSSMGFHIAWISAVQSFTSICANQIY